MCVHRIMAITSAFQADDAGSIPAARSNSSRFSASFTTKSDCYLSKNIALSTLENRISLTTIIFSPENRSTLQDSCHFSDSPKQFTISNCLWVKSVNSYSIKQTYCFANAFKHLIINCGVVRKFAS